MTKTEVQKLKAKKEIICRGCNHKRKTNSDHCKQCGDSGINWQGNSR